MIYAVRKRSHVWIASTGNDFAFAAVGEVNGASHLREMRAEGAGEEVGLGVLSARESSALSDLSGLGDIWSGSL